MFSEFSGITGGKSLRVSVPQEVRINFPVIIKK